jgi:hypothetical protein
MTLPKSVQRELDAAEALQAQLVAPTPAAMETPEAHAQPVVTAPPPAPAPSDEWEHKYRSLQGKYSAEVPSLMAKNKSLEAQVTALAQQVQALATAQQQAKPPEKPVIDPRDVEQFGADLVEMVKRNSEASIIAARREFAEAASALDKRVAALEGSVSGVVEESAQTKEQRFYKELEEKVPDWRQINETPTWLRWLDVVDPVYGVPRQVALTAAHERLDYDRVIGIFKLFKEQVAVPPTLENQVAPRTTNTAPPTTVPGQPKFITSREIEKFYRDQARGVYASNPAEEARIAAEIDAAAAEGRVINV